MSYKNIIQYYFLGPQVNQAASVTASSCGSSMISVISEFVAQLGFKPQFVKTQQAGFTPSAVLASYTPTTTSLQHIVPGKTHC